MKRDTKRTGDISEAIVLAAFVRAGVPVAIPFGENQRYDLVVEIQGRLCRVQVKTGRLRNGVIHFNCCSTHGHRNGMHSRRYVNEVEYFAVFCPDLNEVFLVPIEDVDVAKAVLRVDRPKNNQKQGMRYALDYRLENEKEGGRWNATLWST